MEANVKDIVFLGIVGIGVAGGILSNYLIKRNRPAEFYLAQEAESEASLEKYRLQLEYEDKEIEKKRAHELAMKKLANDREATLPAAYWMYKAAIENKEARKYEADKLDALIEALSNTNSLKGYDDLSNALYILAKRTAKDEKLIIEIIDLLKKLEIACKSEDVSLQQELLAKIKEVEQEESFEEDLKKLEKLKNDDSLDFDFDSLLHKDSV